MDRELRSIQLDTVPTEFPATTPAEEPQVAVEAAQFMQMSQIVRRLYVVLRSDVLRREYNPGPRWDGGVTSSGARYKPAWPNIAAFILRNGYDPIEYMKAQFSEATPTRMPLPNMLCSPAAVELYHNYRRNIGASLSAKLEWELGSIRAEMLPYQQGLNWTYVRALRWALTNDKSVKASGLTRYCLAVEYDLNDIAELYHDRALFQYAFQKDAYDNAWPPNTIPQRLQEEADALIARVLT